MPSLSGNGSDPNKPTPKPSAKKPAARRKRVPDKSDGKKKGKKDAVDLETPHLAEVHEHFLKSLKEEAKAFNDPLLLYLYDMVIYRLRETVEAPKS
ncbi:MAG: hypothetical protein RJS97_22210 [Parvibaculaceae bacterium]